MDGNRSAMTSKTWIDFLPTLFCWFSEERGLVILLIFDIDTLFDCICCFERIVTLFRRRVSAPAKHARPIFQSQDRINQIDLGSNQL